MKRGRLVDLAKRVVTIAYPVLLVLSSLNLTSPAIKIVLLVAPLTVLLSVAVARLTFVGLRRCLHGAVVLLAIGLCFWLNELQHQSLRWLILLQESGLLLVMAAIFGATLFSGGDALCTRFIRFGHDNPSPRLIQYSRQLTAVWSLFFVVSAALSALLFFYLPMAAWALYNSIGIPVCAVMLFVVENQCQRFFLPREELRSLPEIWRVIRAVETKKRSAGQA